VLFVSGSLGLGHATRDLAVAREMRHRMPSIEIDWLCASPTSEMLAGAGELLAPECRDYRCETDTADAQGTADRLNLTAYVYRALLNWIHNARVIGRAVRRGGFDVLVGDETYEIVVAHVLGVSTMPGIPVIMLYDFWGMDIARGGLFERIGAWGLNAIWAQQHRVTGRGNNAALFIGEPADIPDRRFGILLPRRRHYAERHATFLGYMLTFDLRKLPSKQQLRIELGYGSGPLVICTVGGTAIGRGLLELCGRTYPHLVTRLPGIRVVLVCGPRIDPAEVAAPEGVEKQGMVPELYRHLAAADLVVTQGGGTTTIELTALGTPFLFFPVEAQAEQEVTIATRISRHRAGIRMSLHDATPERLAEEIIEHIGKGSEGRGIPFDGAGRAAEIILERLGRTNRGSLKRASSIGT
jgi:UDP:flavonoid glycosyltransferase YjiC (YdhE family)